MKKTSAAAIVLAGAACALPGAQKEWAARAAHSFSCYKLPTKDKIYLTPILNENNSP